MIKDNELLKNMTYFWKKPATVSKRGLIANQSQIKSSQYKINKDFYDDEISKGSYHCNCYSVILFNFVFKIDKNYYLQVFLEE